MSDRVNSAAGKRWRPGPGFLVTAAFIGPGTVATASRAGAQFGFALLWTLLLAVVATMVLQEMAARLGIVARWGLAEAIRESIQPVWARRTAIFLVLTAIVFGNTAYQTGNLLGAGMGLSLFTGWQASHCASILGLLIALVLAIGGASQKLNALLIGMVLAMSAAFVATAVLVRPDMGEAIRAVGRFSLPPGAWLTALALFGTTVVPYNLFLHATAVQQRWSKQVLGSEQAIADAIRWARFDTVIAIAIGGVVTMAIVATAAAAFYSLGVVPANAGELAEQLEPLFGSAGKILFAVGLAAAGVTSAITAPLAAGYAAAGAFVGASQRTVRIVAVGVALTGAVLANVFGKSPQATIITAQAANGLLLPLVALFLLWVMNCQEILGSYRNGWWLNLAGIVVVAATCVLGAKSLAMLFF